MLARTWGDIKRYFTFLSDQQDLYTDVTCVRKVGVVSPPHIPSFEVALKRTNLYNALAESNVMYEVVLLHRLTPELLSQYKVIVIPNIPWMNADQIEAIVHTGRMGGRSIPSEAAANCGNSLMCNLQLRCSRKRRMRTVAGNCWPRSGSYPGSR